jgi:hypothetical protein
VDRRRAYRVLINDRLAGHNRAGESADYQLTPGHHRVRLQIDWASSREIAIDVRRGEHRCFGCAPNATPATTLWFLTFGRRRYIRLSEQDCQPRSELIG